MPFTEMLSKPAQRTSGMDRGLCAEPFDDLLHARCAVAVADQLLDALLRLDDIFLDWRPDISCSAFLASEL